MPSIPRQALGVTIVMWFLVVAAAMTVGRAEAQGSQPAAMTSTSEPTSSVALPQIPDRSFSVRDYGAVGDGMSDDTGAIQAAIDAAGAGGGGMVAIPAGTFLSGPIKLTDGINLHLEEGAVLRMLPFESYPDPSEGEYTPFIHAYKLHDVVISGPGLMEGQGQAWWDQFRQEALEHQRPEMICAWRVERLAILGLRMQNAPKAHIDIGKSRDITIDGVIITAPDESPNTDGIDVWGTNIVIKNCVINSGDDNVAISGNTANVTIRDCKFGVGHGVSIGSSTEGGVKGMLVDRCQFDGTVNALRGKSNRRKGGIVQSLTYSNITMANVKYPFRFESIYDEKIKQAEETQARPVVALTPVWKNVTFKNITAQVVESSKYGAGVLWGLPEMPIENFVFENVKITAHKGFKIYYSKGIVFTDDSEIEITGTSKPLLLYKAEVEAPAPWERGGPRPE